MMNNIDRLKELIKYIEKNLDQEISYKKLASILCVNEYSMHRIFTFITGISISEYIRFRRLSISAIELINSDIKIIDIAIKYGYDSSISFSRAFKKFHGISPSQIKRNQKYIKNYPPINFTNTFTPDNMNIDFKIIKHSSFNLYGTYKKCNVSNIKNIAPIFWQDLSKQYPILNTETSFGIIEYDKLFPKPKTAKYYIASNTQFGTTTKITIPSSTWAVFKIEHVSGESMSSFGKYIYKNWIPYSGYNIKNIPELEVYYTDHTEWWLPIEKDKS